MSADLSRHVGEAFAHWRRGDRALANIRLAFARIPRLGDYASAYRLFLAEELLDAGLSPAALMKGLGFDMPARRGLAKYDPDQPRDSGIGFWRLFWLGRRRGANASARVEHARSRSRRRGSARRERAGNSGRRPVRLGGRQRVSLWPRNIGGGGRPGGDAWRDFHLNSAASFRMARSGRTGPFLSFDPTVGPLRLYRDGETGGQTVAEARVHPDGILAETETGLPIARMVKGSLVFDADLLAELAAGAGARSERDEPKLCPDPDSDVPHGASERAMCIKSRSAP